MVKLQRDWRDVSADLQQCLSTCQLGPQQLAEGAGVSYHSARRYLLSTKPKNKNTTTNALCRYFGVPLEIAKLQKNDVERMTDAIHQVWDGSEPHADLIIELVKVTQAFKIKARK